MPVDLTQKAGVRGFVDLQDLALEIGESLHGSISIMAVL